VTDPIMQCPATMCPLIAPDGSPWTGAKNAPCPGRGGIPTEEEPDRCPWWDMGCGGNGQVSAVDMAERQNGRAFVCGPVRPKRDGVGVPKEFDCPNASFCRWQEQSPTGLCGPREALKRGLDPRVCNF